MPPKQKQKQKQSQNVRVVVNLAEKKKPRKKRGKYRRMKEPSADVSRLAAQQFPRVQVVRYEYPVSGQPQAPPIQVVREPHATPAAVGMNQNAFGTRDTGAPMPDSSARAPVDTPSELEGVRSQLFIPEAMPSTPFAIGAKKITFNKSGAERAPYGSKKKRKGEDIVAEVLRTPEMGGGALGGGGGSRPGRMTPRAAQLIADLGPPPFYSPENVNDLRIATEEKKMIVRDGMKRA